MIKEGLIDESTGLRYERKLLAELEIARPPRTGTHPRVLTPSSGLVESLTVTHFNSTLTTRIRLMKIKGFLAMLMALAASTALADLKEGDAAPDFELTGSDGKTYMLSDLKGTAVVVAWYPKAFTGG